MEQGTLFFLFVSRENENVTVQARREKISERMKCLQNLVPGCDRIAGKAGMLDEIINYVQSLQQQVEVIISSLKQLQKKKKKK